MSDILHSKILGEGAPMLILHGFLGMLDNWKTLGNKYADSGLEVHLIDQRNHGDSFWSDEFHYDAMANDLHRYMTHHKLEKAIVLGHSMGGKTAMQFACNFPEMTAKLIVADISPRFYPPHHDALLDALYHLPLSSLQSRSDADRELARKVPDMGTRQFLLKNLYWEQPGKLGFKCNLEVLREKSAEVGDALEAGGTYEGPALFVHGGRSEYVQAGDRELIRGHFPAAKLEAIAGAGHWLHAEQPESFYNITSAFITA